MSSKSSATTTDSASQPLSDPLSTSSIAIATPDASNSGAADMTSSSQLTQPTMFANNRWPTWVAPIASILLATLVYFVLAQSFSGEIYDSPFRALREDGTDPYLFGLALQEILFPLAFLVILTTRPVFQEFLNGDGTIGRRVQLTLLLALIEIGYIGYVAYTDQGWISFGIFVIVAGGLIGGWRLGLALGVMSFFIEGTIDLFLEAQENYYVLEDNDWLSLLRWYFLGDIVLMAKIWAGFVAGQVGLLVRRYSLGLGIILVTALFLEFVPSMLDFLVFDSSEAVATLWAGSIVNMVALGMFMILVTNAKNAAQLRQAEISRLELTQAELRALRAQINPHFLFNSLNTIRYFVRTDPDQARQLLLNLSDVFQVALKSGETVALKDEIEFTKSYLALEQARLDERLEVSWFVQDDALLDAEVPTLILQPVVENAVVHGIAPDPDGGRLQIMIMGSGDDLVLQVIDDGMGMDEERLELVKSPSAAPDGSIGTLNIQQRLKTLYKDRGEFKVESAVGRGTTVELRVPLH